MKLGDEEIEYICKNLAGYEIGARKDNKYFTYNVVQAIRQLKEERDRYREALKSIRLISEFHSQNGVKDHLTKNAHERNVTIARTALGEDDA